MDDDQYQAVLLAHFQTKLVPDELDERCARLATYLVWFNGAGYNLPKWLAEAVQQACADLNQRTRQNARREDEMDRWIEFQAEREQRLPQGKN
jgi:hypothetical protein